MTQWTRGATRRLALLVATVGMLGCQELPLGPSLQEFELTDIKGQPTVGTPGCAAAAWSGPRAIGRPFPSTPRFSSPASTAPVREISKILYFIQDLAPGSSSAIDAPGFVVPCNAINRFTWEVKVRGVTYPPL